MRIEDSMLEWMVGELIKARQNIKELQGPATELSDKIKEHAERYREDLDGNKLELGDLTLSFTQGTNRRIIPEKLLERGVGAEIIEYATQETHYEQVRVKLSEVVT